VANIGSAELLRNLAQKPDFDFQAGAAFLVRVGGFRLRWFDGFFEAVQ